VKRIHKFRFLVLRAKPFSGPQLEQRRLREKTKKQADRSFRQAQAASSRWDHANCLSTPALLGAIDQYKASFKN